MLVQTEHGIEINERFFNAIEILKQHKKIRGLKTFSTKYNINPGNMSSIRTHQETKLVKAEWLMFLARDFGMSSDWLLLGIGEPFKQ